MGSRHARGSGSCRSGPGWVTVRFVASCPGCGQQHWRRGRRGPDATWCSDTCRRTTWARLGVRPLRSLDPPDVSRVKLVDETSLARVMVSADELRALRP